jgi:hypothetical protein
MNRENQMLGIILIVVGILFLLAKLDMVPVSFTSLWPIVILIPGLGFHFFAFYSRIPGLLIPGGILTTYSLLFFFNEIFGYEWMEHLWPVFILGPGIGLLEFYLFGERKFGILLASLILFTIGGTFLFFSLFGTFIPYLIGILLIITGLYMIFGNKRSTRL